MRFLNKFQINNQKILTAYFYNNQIILKRKQYIQFLVLHMTSTEKRSAHNHFTLHPTEEITIQLSSNFDSGNLQSANFISISDINAQQPPVIKIQLTPAAQPFNPQYSTRQSTKAFFHFNIKANVNITLHACIKRMGILSIIEGSFDEYYNICVGSKKYNYQPPEYVKQRPEYMQLVKNGDDIPQNHKVYFAYHFPYSYEKLCHLLQDLDQNFKHSQQHNQNNQLISGIRGIGFGQNNNIYYRNQLLIESVQGRQVNLITITQIPIAYKKSGLINLPREPRISKTLFPYFDIQDRPFHFNKPYIMITSRVHPGETSASYALQGFIKKLIGSSAQAEFLRKTFVFIIVPMINPDGVFNGTYRMDMLGHNLNRFYNSSAPHKQPAIFAITSLLQHHSEDLVAFFDIHSHPQTKGSFAYGNAYTSIEDQIQSQVFAKLLSLNCESFSYQNCTFSQKNMNSKDINDILTKDGSSRVCAYKKMLSANICNGVHCYALQLGYHGCPIKKEVNKSEQIYQFKSQFRRTQKQFDIVDYLEFGTDLLNTICQVYIQTYRTYMNISDSNILISENNYSTINNSGTPIQDMVPCPLQNLRQEIAKQVYDKDQRFRIMDGGLLRKIRNIQNCIYANLYSKLSKKYPLILQNVKQYDKKKPEIIVKPIKPVDHSPNIKAVQSLQLNTSNPHPNHVQVEIKKVYDYNQEYLKRLKQKMPHRDFKNLIFKSNRQKIHVIPVQFHIPTSVRNANQTKNSRRISFNKILDMQAQSLPRIQKKKLNFLTQRQKIRQKRVQSSINSQNNYQFSHEPMILPLSRGGFDRKYFNYHNQKKTIQSNIENIIQYQNIGNQEEDQEYQKIFMQAAQEYNSNFNPQTNPNLNFLRNQAMFQRQQPEKQKQTIKVINIAQQNHTQRITRRLETNQQRKRSKSKEKNQNIIMHSQNIAFNMKNLPKVHGKTQRIRNKFDLELKMKQKYDKQYKLDDRMGIEGKQK